MYFERGHLYHIYNQGNNRQAIFFLEENYLYFIKKIRIHILPFADILAYCLMPNHFHLMVYIRDVEIDERLVKASGYESGCDIPTLESGRDFKSRPDSPKLMNFNKSIGIMLASYTRAINNQENRTGSIFRKETKAICLTKSDCSETNWFIKNGITHVTKIIPEQQYPAICFNYILNNPVKKGLVVDPREWEYSSYNELSHRKEDSLINLSRIDEFGLNRLEVNSRH